MKNLVIILCFLLSLALAKAQTNLVPNASFEIDTNCNNNLISNAIPWDSPSSGTPDLYNTCGTSINGASPINLFGFQNPHSGNGYVGSSFYGYVGGNYYIEYLQIKLDTNLVAGRVYCAGYEINLANSQKYALKNIGMYFSNSQIILGTTANLHLIPQILDTNYVTDTLNWVHFEGSFTAAGGERYLIIGNFNDSTHTDTLSVRAGFGDMTYYYIDDVDVHYCPSGQGVEEISDEEGMNVWPNPTTDKLTVNSEQLKIKEVRIYNMLGSEILKQVQNDKSVTIDVSGLAKGMYFVEVVFEGRGTMEERVVRKRFVKE